MRIEAHHEGILKRAFREAGTYLPESKGQARSLGTLRAAGYMEKVTGTKFWALTRSGSLLARQLDVREYMEKREKAAGADSPISSY